MSPEKQRIALPELMAMTEEELNRLAAELEGWTGIFWNGPCDRSYGELMGWSPEIGDSCEYLPKYCSSRDLAFELRKGFTRSQHSDYSLNLEMLTVGSRGDMHWKFQSQYDNATARQQTIAAVMVLQQGGV